MAGSCVEAPLEKNELYVEETLPNDGGYEVVWRGGTPMEAMTFLLNNKSGNRLELWRKGHAATDRGYCPYAFRAAGSNRVKVSQTFRMLELSR